MILRLLVCQTLGPCHPGLCQACGAGGLLSALGAATLLPEGGHPAPHPSACPPVTSTHGTCCVPGPCWGPRDRETRSCPLRPGRFPFLPQPALLLTLCQGTALRGHRCPQTSCPRASSSIGAIDGPGQEEASGRWSVRTPLSLAPLCLSPILASDPLPPSPLQAGVLAPGSCTGRCCPLNPASFL